MKNAKDILDKAEKENTKHREHLRSVADWFHQHEGKMFKRKEARNRIADDLNIDKDIAMDTIRNLVGDKVDPIIQVPMKGGKYVGIVEFKEFEGAYGYIDYHDTQGQRKRVVCAQCVHQSEYDHQVTHATAGDPEGSFTKNASYKNLLNGIHKHYKDTHDTKPESVETGASLVSGTTIGGNQAWHAGNDGSGSGLDADTLDGNHGSDLGSVWTVDGTWSVSGSSKFTYNMSNTYDIVKVMVSHLDMSSSYDWKMASLQVNGDTGQNYDYQYPSGGNRLSHWTIAEMLSAHTSGEFILSGSSKSNSISITSHILADEHAAYHGHNTNVSPPLNSMSIYESGENYGYIEMDAVVLGFDP